MQKRRLEDIHTLLEITTKADGLSSREDTRFMPAHTRNKKDCLDQNERKKTTNYLNFHPFSINYPFEGRGKSSNLSSLKKCHVVAIKLP